MKHHRLSEDIHRHTDPNTYRVASVLKTIFYTAEMAHQNTAFEYNAF